MVKKSIGLVLACMISFSILNSNVVSANEVETEGVDTEVNEVETNTSSENGIVNTNINLLSTKTGSWGGCSWTFDTATGVLVVSAGNLGDYTDSPWYQGDLDESDIKKIVFEENVKATSNSRRLFRNLDALEEIKDIHNLDVSNIVNMSEMFENASALKKLDLSLWQTGNVVKMYAMFYGTSSLEEVIVEGWNTNSVEDMMYMFTDASNLTSLNLSGWDVTNVEDMFGMFDGMTSLESLNLSGWDIVNSSNYDMNNLLNDVMSLNTITLGENFKFISSNADVGLPEPSDTSIYTGKWVGVTSGNVFASSDDLVDNYDGTSHADTYVLERIFSIDGNDYIVVNIEDINSIDTAYLLSHANVLVDSKVNSKTATPYVKVNPITSTSEIGLYDVTFGINEDDVDINTFTTKVIIKKAAQVIHVGDTHILLAQDGSLFESELKGLTPSEIDDKLLSLVEPMAFELATNTKINATHSVSHSIVATAATYPMTIKMVEDGIIALDVKIEVKKDALIPSKPSITPKANDSSNSPNTGVESMISLYMSMLCLTSVIAIFSYRHMKKTKKQDS